MILELVGPAGAGKSSLTRVLEAEPDCTVLFRVRKRKNWTLVLSQAPQLLLIAARVAIAHLSWRLGPLPSGHDPSGNGSSVTLRSLWRGVHGLGFLHLMRVRVQLHQHDSLVVLDEGPVFMLAKLAQMRERGTLPPYFDAPLRQERARWSRALTMVVHLDAPNQVLAHRIRTRSSKHIVKDASDREIAEFLEGWRRALHRVCDDICEIGDVSAAQYDTTSISAHDLRADLQRRLLA